MSVGIKKFQGQLLHLVEQIRPELCHSVLGHMDHDPGIAIGTKGPRSVNAAHDAEHFRKPDEVAGKNIVVDQGLDEVGACHGTGGADHQQHHHDHQQGLVPAQVAHELAQGAPQVLGFPEAAPGAAAGASGSPSCMIVSHRCSLLPAGIHRPRGKFRRSSSVLHGCPEPPLRHCPSPGSDQRP